MANPSTMQEDRPVSPVQGINDQNRPFASWLMFGNVTSTQLKWTLGPLGVGFTLRFAIFVDAGAWLWLVFAGLCGVSVCGYLWNVEGKEHTRKQQLRRLARPRVYAPVTPLDNERILPVPLLSHYGVRVLLRGHGRAWRRVWRGRLYHGRLRWWTLHRIAADPLALIGAHTQDGEGIYHRTERAATKEHKGGVKHTYVATIEALPVILRSMSVDDREEVFSVVAAQVAKLKTDEKLTLSVRNQPDDVGAVVAALESTRRNTAPFFEEMAAREAEWLEEKFGDSYAVSATCTIALSGPTRPALIRRVKTLITALDSVGSGGRLRGPQQASRRLWEAVHLGRHDDIDETAAVEMVHAEEGSEAMGMAGWVTRSFFVADLTATLLPLALADLSLLGINSAISYTFEGLEPVGALEWLRAKGRSVAASNAGVIGTTGHDDKALSGQVNNLADAYIMVKSGQAKMVNAGIVFTVIGRDRVELDDAALGARSALEDAGLVVYEGIHDQARLLREQWPMCYGPTHPFKMLTAPWPFMPLSLETPTDTPIQTVWGRTQIAGQMVGHNWSAGATPALCICADQGIGKSAALATLIHSARKRREWVLIVDPSLTFPDYVASDEQGTQIDLLAPGVNVNILEFVGLARDNQVPAAIDLMELIYGRAKPDFSLSNAQEAILEDALTIMYEKCRQRNRRPRALYIAAYMRYHHGIERQREQAGAKDTDAALYRDMWLGLRPFYGRHTYASLMDRPTSHDVLSELLMINTKRINRIRGLGSFLGLTVATTLADYRTMMADQAGNEHRICIDEAHNVFAKAIDWFSGNARYIRHEKNSLAVCTHKVSDLLANPEIATSLTAIKKWVILRCSDKLEVLEDTIGLPPHLIKRARRLRRDKNRSEAIYVNNQPGADTKYGVFDFLIEPTLLGLTESYKEQKAQRGRETVEAGTAAAAIFARVPRHARPIKGRHTGKDDKTLAA